ncbi:hypothetical protein AJ80_08109 [Polytolypa hystricis UAMH7299]|uniref:Uncharacterized protein n=1 Tax=Polytolypa hystricis (strain UAMH7299) TaxID=1447883 RepID=A0A2B7XCH2_POLH7|nr:hypothetical protein AJ80_08109 [Polytolypa hystricis UAMH7299]
MKSFLRSAFFGILSASSVLSLPLEARQEQTISDLDVLQFALTLEHLENVFYKGALQRFSEQHFHAAGFDSKFFSQVKFVASDEQAHVVFLTDAIAAAGGTPVAACQYEFPYTDVRSFVALASVLEGVGVSAYLGGAAVLSSKDILTAAGAILVAEGLHQAVHRDSLHQVASAKIVGTPLGPNGIFTLASAFISSCPEGNPPLPFQAFPGLSPAQGNPNTVRSLTGFRVIGAIQPPEAFFVTFVNGLDVISVPGSHVDGIYSAEIPTEASGQTFAFLTNADVTGGFQDSAVIAGPAIIEVTPAAPNIDFSIL